MNVTAAPQDDAIAPDIAHALSGASILITGGTGSFGKAFIRRLLDQADPARIIVYSRDELKQFDMQMDPAFQDNRLRFFIGDVRDGERLTSAMRGVDYVVHAAALKHVGAAEYNPFECIKTNVHGAENVVHAAINSGVKRVIALSTDKAANPINLYGASKLASDKIFIAANSLVGGRDIRFSVVRYGNVAGSRGSVLRFFAKLLREGKRELPITDARMTRFWITLDEGVDFVLSSIPMARGGEIFVPKIPSIRITDLAEAMNPGGATDIVGIRPGEKLHEVMVSEDDARSTVELDGRYVIEPQIHFWTADRAPLDGSRPVAEDFYYRSDTNPWFLEGEELRRHTESLLAGFAAAGDPA